MCRLERILIFTNLERLVLLKQLDLLCEVGIVHRLVVRLQLPLLLLNPAQLLSGILDTAGRVETSKNKQKTHTNTGNENELIN